MKSITLLAILLAVAPASAQDRTGLVSVSLSGGGAFPLGPKTVRRSAGIGTDFGAAVRYGLSERYDLAFSYDSLNMRKARSLRVEPVLISFIRSYRRGGFWTPAWRIGAGPVIVHEARPLDTRSQSSFAVRTGLGADYSFTPDLGLGAWADYLFAAHSNSDSREVHAATLNLTLTWRLGKLQARTPPQRTEPAAPVNVRETESAPAEEATAAPAPAEPAEAPKPAKKAAPKKKRATPKADSGTPDAVQAPPVE